MSQTIPMKRVALWLLLTSVASLALPTAQAHGAPAPASDFLRVLGDHDDDCGPEQSSNDCRGGSDLIALDVKERLDAASGQDVVVFRFFLDQSNSPDYPVTNTVTFSTPAGGKTLAITSNDGTAWTSATGFDSVGPAVSLGDGSRFTVDAHVKAATLGVAQGQRLSTFRVESRTDGLGDYMPGGCNNSLLACQGTVPGSGARDTHYDVRGPTYYLAIEGGAAATVAVGSVGHVDLTFANKLAQLAQDIDVQVTGADGVEAGFEVAAGSLSPTLQLSLARKCGNSGAADCDPVQAASRQDRTLHLHGLAEGSGTLTITALTSQGGRTLHTIEYTVTPAEATTPPPATPPPAAEGDGDDRQGAPAPATPLLVVALAGLAAIHRRA